MTAHTPTASPGVALPLLIGLTGRAGAGKDTAARRLESRWGFRQFAMADALRAMLLTLCDEAGIGTDWLTDPDKKNQPGPLGFSGRRAMQTLGTEWGRQLLGQGVWIRIAQGKLDTARLHQEHVVISDIRFPDEAAWVKAQGGVMVRLARIGGPLVERHESEDHAELMQVSYTLLNNSGIDLLYDHVDNVLEDIAEAAGLTLDAITEGLL